MVLYVNAILRLSALSKFQIVLSAVHPIVEVIVKGTVPHADLPHNFTTLTVQFISVGMPIRF